MKGFAVAVVPWHCAQPEPTDTPDDPRVLIVATPSITHPFTTGVAPPASAIENRSASPVVPAVPQRTLSVMVVLAALPTTRAFTRTVVPTIRAPSGTGVVNAASTASAVNVVAAATAELPARVPVLPDIIFCPVAATAEASLIGAT